MCKYTSFTMALLGTKKVSREDVETALDQGKLFVRMRNGNNWRVRRNGKTQTWVKEPSRFRIPCKAGFRVTFQLTDADLYSFPLHYVIED
jgi:hypothetical protein